MAKRTIHDTDKPMIGISTTNHENAQAYIAAIERSGGEPRLIMPINGLSDQNWPAGIEGLLLCGSEEPYSNANLQRTDRHPSQRSLLEMALKSDMPTLCIGTGMHSLNLTLGGKTTRDVIGHGTHKSNDNSDSSYHRIYISPGSKLAAIVGSGGFVRVNSRHQQGLKEAQKSPQLMASAYSLEDGVIEALESPKHRFVVAVQFHPERILEIPPHFERLFQSLVHLSKITKGQ